MGAVKSAYTAWLEAEANGHIHPAIAQALRAVQPPPTPEPNTVSPTPETMPTYVYALYCNGVLLDLYKLRETADYECYLCRMGEEQYRIYDEDGDFRRYEVRELEVFTHKPHDAR
jgi:hypothetical protein